MGTYRCDRLKAKIVDMGEGGEDEREVGLDGETRGERDGVRAAKGSVGGKDECGPTQYVSGSRTARLTDYRPTMRSRG